MKQIIINQYEVSNGRADIVAQLHKNDLSIEVATQNHTLYEIVSV